MGDHSSKPGSRPMMRLKARPKGGAKLPRIIVRAGPGPRSPPPSVPTSTRNRARRNALVLTDTAGKEISIEIRPDGSAAVSRAGAPPSGPAPKTPNLMVFQGRFGQIAIGVDKKGRFLIGREVRPLAARKRRPTPAVGEKPLGTAPAAEPAPWDESEPWDESV